MIYIPKKKYRRSKDINKREKESVCVKRDSGSERCLKETNKCFEGRENSKWNHTCVVWCYSVNRIDSYYRLEFSSFWCFPTSVCFFGELLWVRNFTWNFPHWKRLWLDCARGNRRPRRRPPSRSHVTRSGQYKEGSCKHRLRWCVGCWLMIIGIRIIVKEWWTC